jgi:hypothetical protein
MARTSFKGTYYGPQYKLMGCRFYTLVPGVKFVADLDHRRIAEKFVAIKGITLYEPSNKSIGVAHGLRFALSWTVRSLG